MQITTSLPRIQARTQAPPSVHQSESQTPTDAYVPSSPLSKAITYTGGAVAGGALGAFVGAGSGFLSGVGGAAVGVLGGASLGFLAGAASMQVFPTDGNGLGNVVIGTVGGAAAGLATGIMAGGFGVGGMGQVALSVLGVGAGLAVAHQFA